MARLRHNIVERRTLRTLMVLEALSSLTPEQLKVMIMRNAYGFTIEETMRACGKNFRWVRKQYWDGMLQAATYFGI